MSIKQLSVFVENKPGKLAQIISVLADNKVDLRALSIADTADFGILRLIADDAKKAADVLEKENILVSITDIVAVKVPDECGSLSRLLNILTKEGINIEYIYSFLARDDKNAFMAFRILNNDNIENILSANGYSVALNKDLGIK